MIFQNLFESFKAFNSNAINNFVYVLTSNAWFFLILVGVFGTIVLLLKEEVDVAIRDEQGIL